MTEYYLFRNRDGLKSAREGVREIRKQLAKDERMHPFLKLHFKEGVKESVLLTIRTTTADVVVGVDFENPCNPVCLRFPEVVYEKINGKAGRRVYPTYEPVN